MINRSVTYLFLFLTSQILDFKYDIIILDDKMEKKSKNLDAKKMKLKEISEFLEKSGISRFLYFFIK